MTKTVDLLRAGHELASDFPALLAEAEKLAASFTLGFHGRRRTGNGDEFWQYRQAEPGESSRFIDWRRSARSDGTYIREKEWQASQTVTCWLSSSASMDFSSDEQVPTKHDRGRLLILASALLLLRSGERVGLSPDVKPAASHVQEERIAEGLMRQPEDNELAFPNQSKALVVSDFLDDFPRLERQVREASERGVSGILLQILDPAEVSFPYKGRAIFHNHGNLRVHETQKSEALQRAYLQRLSNLQDNLRNLARETGWHFHYHVTDARAFDGLQWVFQTLEIGR